MQPSKNFQFEECNNSDNIHVLDYSPIKLPRNSSCDINDQMDLASKNVLMEKFKIKLRHTSTLPIYEKEEEEKKEKPIYSKKKQLKLVTNNKIEDDMEKSKSFSPQPSHINSIKIYSSFFTFLPNKSLKKNNSLPQSDDYHYFEDFFDICTRKGSMKQQQDKVFFLFFFKFHKKNCSFRLQ